MKSHTVGDIEIVTLFDGTLTLDAEVFPDFKPERARIAAKQAGVPHVPGKVELPVNTFVIRAGDALVLVDAGSPKGWMPGVGRFPESLHASGFDPLEFTHVVLTHMHIDHVGGLVDAAGQAVFANAELISGAGEWGYFFDPIRQNGLAPDRLRTLQTCLNAVRPYADQRREGQGETDICPGLTLVPLPGHTPGHSGVMISSLGEEVLIWGDVVHSEAYQLGEPDWGVQFDTDGDQARQTRKNLFDQVATDRLAIAGHHLHGPAFAHLERCGSGYRLIRDL